MLLRFFTAIWALIKPWIDPVTSDKIKILGSDYLSHLREYIDDSQIPPELGGSCPDFTWEAPYPAAYGASLEQLQAKVESGPSIYEEEKFTRREGVLSEGGSEALPDGAVVN